MVIEDGKVVFQWTRRRWCPPPWNERLRALTRPACWSLMTRRPVALGHAVLGALIAGRTDPFGRLGSINFLQHDPYRLANKIHAITGTAFPARETTASRPRPLGWNGWSWTPMRDAELWAGRVFGCP